MQQNRIRTEYIHANEARRVSVNCDKIYQSLYGHQTIPVESLSLAYVVFYYQFSMIFLSRGEFSTSPEPLHRVIKYQFGTFHLNFQ